MEYFSDEGTYKEGCDGGPEHESDCFAELTPEFPIEDDRAVKCKSCDEQNAHGSGRDERDEHGADKEIGERQTNNGAQIRNAGRECRYER